MTGREFMAIHVAALKRALDRAPDVLYARESDLKKIRRRYVENVVETRPREGFPESAYEDLSHLTVKP